MVLIDLKLIESYTFECFDSDEVAPNEQKCILTAENGFTFYGALSRNHQVVTFKESIDRRSLFH